MIDPVAAIYSTQGMRVFELAVRGVCCKSKHDHVSASVVHDHLHDEVAIGLIHSYH
jgi:hypothetical protein